MGKVESQKLKVEGLGKQRTENNLTARGPEGVGVNVVHR